MYHEVVMGLDLGPPEEEIIEKINKEKEELDQEFA